MDRKTLTEGIDVETRLEPGCQDGMIGIIRVPDRIMMTGILIGDVHSLLDQPLTTIFPVQARASHKGRHLFSEGHLLIPSLMNLLEDIRDVLRETIDRRLIFPRHRAA